MPIHDWTRVDAGIWHSFHLNWIGELVRALNNGVLPADYYALGEQRASEYEPDLIALERRPNGAPAQPTSGGFAGATALATVAPPRTSVVEAIDDQTVYARKGRFIAIRHVSDDRVVALLELVSPGNKDRARAVDQFVGKCVMSLQAKIHVTLIDLFPPGRLDPNGLHDLIAHELGGNGSVSTPEKPLTLAAYRAAEKVYCYVEPVAVGMSLAEFALFFEPDRYVSVPLEQTYLAAYLAVPRRWAEVIEAPA